MPDEEPPETPEQSEAWKLKADELEDLERRLKTANQNERELHANDNRRKRGRKL